MSRRGREALQDVRKRSRDPPRCPSVVERPSQEAVLDVRKARPYVREWSAGPPGCPGVVGRPSRMSGSGGVAILDVWEWWGGHPGCLVVVWRPSRMSRSVREILPNV